MKVKKEKPNNKNNKGFTLVEVLLAIVILSLVSAPILRGFIVTANTSARARTIMEATDVAQLIIEEISAMSFDGDVKDTFFVETATERLPAIGYNVAGTKSPIATSQFQQTVATSCADSKKCYISEVNPNLKMVALPNVEYDGKKYDVMIDFVPNSGEGTQFYTYDVTVRVFDQDVTDTEEDDGTITHTYTHYRNKLVELKTEISNKY